MSFSIHLEGILCGAIPLSTINGTVNRIPTRRVPVRYRMDDSKEQYEDDTRIETQDVEPNLGDIEERRRIEKKLLWKLDLRMSILLVIYILNYVGLF